MKIFHHDDMDGFAAASVVMLYFAGADKKDGFFDGAAIKNKYNISKGLCETIIHNKEKDEPKFASVKNHDTVIIVDISFTDETKHYLDILLEKKCNIIWIDHHQSSIDLLEKYPKYRGIKGIIKNGISGALLTYMFFYKETDPTNAPIYLQYISDYDCWINKLQPNTDFFKLGYDAEDDKFEALYNLFEEYIECESTSLDKFISNGKILKQYIMNDHNYYRETYGYESKLEDGTPVYCVNKSTNSWVFGDLYDKYPVVCNYAFDGKEYEYSLYSNSNSEFNCGKYCEKHGGGGHKGAAGFRSKELLYKKI